MTDTQRGLLRIFLQPILQHTLGAILVAAIAHDFLIVAFLAATAQNFVWWSNMRLNRDFAIQRGAASLYALGCACGVLLGLQIFRLL